MIKFLRGINFQKHSKIEIEFDKITTIIGPTDVGKSAIIRLIKWIATNKPSGDFFIQHGKEFCRGEIELEDFYIIREKGKGVNSYSLNNKEYKSFGNKVPEEIEKVINIEDTNFQLQIDLPFWFLKTPGEVSKELNKIVNLEKIDSSLYNINSKLRETSTEIKLNQERFTKAKENERNLFWVLECDKDISIIETKQKELLEISTKINNLNQIINSIKTYTSTIKIYKELQDFNSKLLSKNDELELLNSKIKKLTKVIKEIEDNQDQWEHYKLLSIKKEKEMEKMLVGICPVCGKEMKNTK